MGGIINLNELLKNINPELSRKRFVFSTVGHKQPDEVSYLNPFAAIQEDEGLTVILEKKTADEHNISYESVFCKITLRVNSSLLAIGLTAAVAKVLAEQNISANVVAAYFHDHVFVPEDKAETALSVIKSLSD